MPRRHHWPYLYLWKPGPSSVGFLNNHWWFTAWAFGTRGMLPHIRGDNFIPTVHA